MHIESAGVEQLKAERRYIEEPTRSGRLTSITLIVRDLPAVAHFYRNVLGLPVRGSGGGFVTVGNWLLIRQSSDPEDRSKRRLGTVIEITVADIEEIRRRIGEEPLRQASSDVLELHDPEGNLVVVRGRPL
jgi:catechol 2,3-dioxygenase-like lactoylglutathione lyase family enzyme